MTETDFAHRLGMSASHINRLVSGERGKRGASKELRDAAERAFGLRQGYWTDDLSSEDDEIVFSPISYMTSTAFNSLRAAQKAAIEKAAWAAQPPPGFGPTSEPREELRKIAAQRGEHAVVSALTLIDAPADADWPWWVRAYLEALDKTRAPTK